MQQQPPAFKAGPTTPQPYIEAEQKAYRQSAASRQMGVPPPSIVQDKRALKASPNSNYSTSGLQPDMGFWNPEIIEAHQYVPSYFELTSKYPMDPQ